MVSLQPLRAALTAAVMALGRTEKLLVKVCRKEATLTEVWNEAAGAADALRKFDHEMACLKLQHDNRQK